jgi:hypothetical protein
MWTTLSVPWRGLVSFLLLRILVEIAWEVFFQSPGGDWCHFYQRRQEDDHGFRLSVPWRGLVSFLQAERLLGLLEKETDVSVPWRGLVSFLLITRFEGLPGTVSFQSPGGDWCHFYECRGSREPAELDRFSPLAGIGVISTHELRNAGRPQGLSRFSPLAGIGVISTVRRSLDEVLQVDVSVPWRGLVSFLLTYKGRERPVDLFQSPGGDWCHFYQGKREGRTARLRDGKRFSPLAGIGVISTGSR